MYKSDQHTLRHESIFLIGGFTLCCDEWWQILPIPTRHCTLSLHTMGVYQQNHSTKPKILPRTATWVEHALKYKIIITNTTLSAYDDTIMIQIVNRERSSLSCIGSFIWPHLIGHLLSPDCLNLFITTQCLVHQTVDQY